MSATHDRYLRRRQHPKESWIVRAAAHSIITSAVASTEDGCNFGNVGIRDSTDKLSTVLGDTLLLKLLTDHKACDVLEEDERDLTLAAELDKMCSF